MATGLFLFLRVCRRCATFDVLLPRRAPAFHLHDWFPGEQFGSVVTHQVPIGNFDGPHPFFESDGKLL
ncbi:MAG: phosphodiesterase [Bradyrhizobium sp.]|nr:phosphodiesterase [Bradyrhizobium sp.]